MQYLWKRKVNLLRIVLLTLLLTVGTTSWTQELKTNPTRATTTAAEDWSSLQLTNNELTPGRPLLGERDDLPQFT